MAFVSKKSKYCSLLISVICLISVIPTNAFAITVYNDGHKIANNSNYYYAVQDTRYTSDGTLEYFGWKGMKGSYYWKRDGTLGSDWPAHINACFSMKMSDGGWVQVGIMNYKNSTGEYRRYYFENQRNGVGLTQNILTTESIPSPTAVVSYIQRVSTDAEGNGKWELGIDTPSNAFKSIQYWNNRTSGKATAQDEIQRPKDTATSTLPEVWFGTNTTGWNGSTYQLQLLPGNDVWERWDESLTAQGSRAHHYQEYSRYSIGYPYYYFAAYTP